MVSDDGELVGYLHIKDVLEYDHDDDRDRPVADKWIRPLARVSEDDLLNDALETLQRRGAHMARAVDARARCADWSRSRTSSRSWSVRSATPPTSRTPDRSLRCERRHRPDPMTTNDSR